MTAGTFTAAQDGAASAAPWRVAADGGWVVVGDQHGSVTVYRSARFNASSKPLWSAKVHDGAVTSIVVKAAAGFAFTAGRDGHVYRHDLSRSPETAADEEASELHKSRVVCRVSGELRCLAVDDDLTKLFLCGDSVRYITLADRPSVTTVQQPLAAPIAAVSVSPCGSVLALASASTGDVCIIGLVPPAAGIATQQTAADDVSQPGALPVSDAKAFRNANAKFLLRGVLGRRWRREENCELRMTWCRETPPPAAEDSSEVASSYLLAMPTDDGVRLFRFHPRQLSAAPSEKPQLSTYTTVSIEGVSEICAAFIIPHSKTDVTMVLSGLKVKPTDESDRSPTPIVAALKVVLKKSAVSYTYLGYHECPATVTAVAVDTTQNGNLWVTTNDGRVGLFKSAVPAPRKAPSKTSTPIDASKVNDADDDSSALHVVGNRSSIPTIGGSAASATATTKKSSSSTRDDDGGNSSAGERSDVSSNDDDGDSNASEDMSRTVKELMRSDRHILSSRSKRKSQLRTAGNAPDDDPLRASRRVVPSYLDDEAEENDSSDSGDDRDIADVDDAYEEEGADSDAENDVNSAADEDDVEDDGMGGAGRLPKGAHATTQQHGHVTANVDYVMQPGATPLRDIGEEGATQARYLAYNSIGCIRFNSTDGVIIQFHDMSRPAMKIAERGHVLMAAIGCPGAAFVMDAREHMDVVAQLHNAASGDEISATGSSLYLYFRTYVALGAQADWRVPLLPGETCRCVAVGLRYVALATSVGLRIFSLSGLELAVLSVPARVIALVGCNSTRLAESLRHDQDYLAVAYHSSGASGLRLTVYNCHNATALVKNVEVPLSYEDVDSGDHVLQWIGWSDDGPLHVCDSAGVVRMLTEDWGGATWVSVYDPRHFTSDPIYTYWVWAVNDQYLFAYKSPKGSKEFYPVANMTGTTNTPMDQVRLCLPLLRGGAAGGEKQVLARDRFLRTCSKVNALKRSSTHYTPAIAKQDALHDAKILEWFKQALKEQHTSRAVDLATMFQLRDSVEEAAKFANAEGHKAVVVKLVNLVDARHKLKLKRLCQLPLEGQDVTDKERDQLLKKFLLKEKQSLASAGAAAQGGGSGPRDTISSHTSNAVRVPTAIERNATLDNSTLYTVETSAEEEAAAKRLSSGRRSIAFAEDHIAVAAPPSVSAPPSTAALRAAPSVLGGSSSHAASTAVSAKPEPPKFSAPATKAEPPLFHVATTEKGTVHAAERMPEAPRGERSLAGQQVLGASPPTKSPQQCAAGGTESKQKSVKPTTTTTSVSPARPQPKKTLPSVTVPARSSHVAEPQIIPAPKFVDLSETPSDPFLLPGEDGTRTASGAMDLGHQHAASSQPKTFSFGDALRKRYRDEDVDEDGGDGAVGAALLGSMLQGGRSS